MGAPYGGSRTVLIVGAGPTGLALALWLARLGVGLRIIDKVAEPGTTSRALAVQARTLEFYRQIGLADAVAESGRKFTAVNLWVSGRKVARARFGNIGEGLSPYPFALIYPQDEHERLLAARLEELGVAVERGSELTGLEVQPDRVVARLRRPDGSDERCAAAYLAGCDGARSSVREALGIGFPGGTYNHLFYVADVEAGGPVADGELHVALDVADFVAVFPLKGAGRLRLIGTISDEARRRDGLAWRDVSKGVLDQLGIDVARVNWFSTYHVHHRVADRFRAGPVFLLGDAAHVHSPVGGQGMNTGIGDAVNLAWKLADVLDGRAAAAILDTFEPERVAFARRLVATTDNAFTIVTSRNRLARFVRLHLVPYIIPSLFAVPVLRRLLFRTVSQTAIEYRASALSAGHAGAVHGGDRLPWVAEIDNFAALTSLTWQVHVYGDVTQDLKSTCEHCGLDLHVFPWHGATSKAGLARHAAYLVRPDGYVALADARASGAALAKYLDEHGITLRPAARKGARVA